MSNKAKRRRFKRIPSRRKIRIYIPLDLQISTLLRLPVKSLQRFQCVSKVWSSIITSRDFRNQHFNIAASSSPPPLLITFKDFYHKKLLLVMLRNPNASSSSPCRVPYRDLSLLKAYGKMVNNTVRGLISLRIGENEGISNPSTRLLDIFPQIKFKIVAEFDRRPKYYFGYDPVEDQYKVLAIDQLFWRAEHKVLVVGGEGGWRDVSLTISSHWAHTSGLYMNGFIYYGAVYQQMPLSSHNDFIIVCFNVRLETFNIIKVPRNLVPDDNMWVDTPYQFLNKILINYGGKIGVVEPLSDPFSLFYFNLKTKNMRSVEIEGLPISKLEQVMTVSDHYENCTSL